MIASETTMATDVCWFEQEQASVPRGDDWLGPSELRIAAGLRFPKRKADWRLGRWTAKHALIPFLSATGAAIELSAIEILAAPSGAPEAFWRGNPIPLAISLTHRGGVAACAVAAAQVALGCDLEIIEPRSRVFVADYFTIDEQALLAEMPEADRNIAVAVIWSAKESVLKALRTGLREDTRSVAVDPFNLQPCADASPEAWAPLVACAADGRRFEGWWRHGDGLVRTLFAWPSCERVVELASAGQHSQRVSPGS